MTPSQVQVATQSNWLASSALYDLRKPYIDATETKSWGTQDISGLFEKLGGVNYVAARFGKHFEEDRLSKIIHATGTTAGALGAVTYTVVAADTMTSWPGVYDPYIATGTGLGGATLVPVRVHEVLEFPGKIKGKVTAVSGATFTVTPTGSTDLPTTISTDEIWSLGISTPEGFEGQLDSMNWTENVVSWKSEIMADTHKSTGSAMIEALWLTVTDDKGASQNSWYFKGQKNAHKQFVNYKELKWVFGEAVTNATTLATNYSAQYTQTSGLIPFAKSYGNNPTYDLTTGLDKEDFSNIIIDTLNKNAGSTENALYEAINVKKVMDSFLTVEMQNGGIQYNAMNGKEAYVNLGFSGFTLLDYTFHNKVYEVFNNPAMAVGYRNFSFGVPMSKDMYKCDGDKEKVEVPSMRVNYMKNGSVSREMIETVTGGVMAGYTSNADVIKIDFRSENGAEFFGSNRFFTLEGTNQ